MCSQFRIEFHFIENFEPSIKICLWWMFAFRLIFSWNVSSKNSMNSHQSLLSLISIIIQIHLNLMKEYLCSNFCHANKVWNCHIYQCLCIHFLKNFSFHFFMFTNCCCFYFYLNASQIHFCFQFAALITLFLSGCDLLFVFSPPFYRSESIF